MLYSVNELMKMMESIDSSITSLENDIRLLSVFNCASNEKMEDAKPDYDVLAAFEKIQELTNRKTKIRDAINYYNMNTMLSDLELTISEALFLLPHLSSQLRIINDLSSRPQKLRARVSPTDSFVDYTYANYDVNKAKEKAKELEDKIAKIHLEIDFVNTLQSIEF